MEARDRVPLPIDQVFDRLELKPSEQGLDAVLDSVQLKPRVCQDFRPLAQSLEWELSDLHWRKAGLMPFVENDVPYTINNDSRLSESAAAVLFSRCLEAPAVDEIRVLELGAGTGLFARYLLDSFRAMCERNERDFYERLTFFVSDRSPSTVRQWQERGVFAEHEAHVALGTCDAVHPTQFTRADGGTTGITGLTAVFCNYVLDTLPASVVRQGENGCEELCVRTHLTDDQTWISRFTKLTLEEIRALAESGGREDREKLIPLVNLFEFENAYLKANDPPPYAAEALSFASGLNRVVVNHGALRCLEACLEALAPQGFVLINDYGPVQLDQVVDQAVPQRFGPTTALGLNFPLVEHHLEKAGAICMRADEDGDRPIHSRLVCKGPVPGATEAFRRHFSGNAHRMLEQPLEDARKHLESGRMDQAMEAYQTAVRKCPRDWRLIGEVAEFVIRQVADYKAGLELSRTAVAINPWYSAWLWNVLGDALFALERYDEALETYRQARRIDARDPRTYLNLAYSYAQDFSYAEALEAIAEGLSNDPRGMYRDRLLEKQQQILAEIAAKEAGAQEWLARRAARLQS